MARWRSGGSPRTAGRRRWRGGSRSASWRSQTGSHDPHGTPAISRGARSASFCSRAARRRVDATRRSRPRSPPTRSRRGSPARAVPLLRAPLPRTARASMTAGSGSPRCWRCERRSSANSSRRCRAPSRSSTDDVAAEEIDLALRDDRRAGGPVGGGRTSSARPRSSRCASSWSTVPPTSSRRPTRIPGRSRACPARPRRRWSRYRPTSTAAAGRSGSTPSCSPARCAALGLDPSYGAYLDLIPGVTLATVNLMSLFGLHRRLARRDRRPPGPVRDDLVDPQPPLRRRSRAGSASAATPRCSSTSTSRPMRSTRSVAAVDLAGGSRAPGPGRAAQSCGAPGRSPISATAGRRISSSRWDEGRSSLLGERQPESLEVSGAIAP